MQNESDLKGPVTNKMNTEEFFFFLKNMYIPLKKGIAAAAMHLWLLL